MTARTRMLALRTLTVVAAAGCSDGGDAPTLGGGPAALVTFAFRAHPQDTLVVEVRDTASARRAREYVATGRGPHIPSGWIVRGAGADPRYPFHFTPGSVRLAEATIELCDGAPMRTAAAVDQYMRGATGQQAPDSARWCPWSAYPVAVR
ncbi:hypothetical protein [Roseisolibacter sp. H3M3-2]|uniref:BP74-related protein n=1 Tax=Roseisolibacter sp. H3M3-2 TaxID=3031323 RepID=UPI0023DB2B1F|nr:hypothetical protein [Roseisolibacter sp. H3M3-2]MDF1503183.1 hypothetical protein [Roseisolibacter sp. H3M3-2]